MPICVGLWGKVLSTSTNAVAWWIHPMSSPVIVCSAIWSIGREAASRGPSALADITCLRYFQRTCQQIVSRRLVVLSHSKWVHNFAQQQMSSLTSTPPPSVLPLRAIAQRQHSWRLLICRHSGCTVASGIVDVCNRSQMRTSKCRPTCLIFGVNIGLDPG